MRRNNKPRSVGFINYTITGVQHLSNNTSLRAVGVCSRSSYSILFLGIGTIRTVTIFGIGTILVMTFLWRYNWPLIFIAFGKWRSSLNYLNLPSAILDVMVSFPVGGPSKMQALACCFPSWCLTLVDPLCLAIIVSHIVRSLIRNLPGLH